MKIRHRTKCSLLPLMPIKRRILCRWLHAYLFQFSSVAQSCPTLCDPMNCSRPGLPVHHQLPEFTQTHVHRVGDNRLNITQIIFFIKSHVLASVFPSYSNLSLNYFYDTGFPEITYTWLSGCHNPEHSCLNPHPLPEPKSNADVFLCQPLINL